MANEYFDPGDQRAAKVNDLFTRIARRYDLINDLQSFGLHRYWKRRVIELSGAAPGLRALDVCCGTGDLALALAWRGVETIGLDFTQSMLDVAATRARAAADRGLVPTPKFVRGDAQQLPFPDHSFDIVTVGYGLRNLASWETGLAEIRRVAKPGGRVLVLDFGKPDNRVWRGLYFAYLRLFVPLLGLVFCRNAKAYAYILESLIYYPAQRGVANRMRHLGLAEVEIVSFLGGVMTINRGRKPCPY